MRTLLLFAPLALVLGCGGNPEDPAARDTAKRDTANRSAPADPPLLSPDDAVFDQIRAGKLELRGVTGRTVQLTAKITESSPDGVRVVFGTRDNSGAFSESRAGALLRPEGDARGTRYPVADPVPGRLIRVTGRVWGIQTVDPAPGVADERSQWRLSLSLRNITTAPLE